MQKKFILNLILIIAVNLLIKPLYIFGVEINVQNTIGSIDYGMYYALFNLSYILSFILDPGITNFNNRHIAQNQHLLDKSFSNIIITKILLSIIFITSILLYGFISSLTLIEWQIISLLIFGQIFNSFTLYNRSNIAGLHLFKTDTIVSIADKLFMILFCVPYFIIDGLRENMNVYTFVLFQTISFGITAITSFFIVKHRTVQFQLKFNLNKIIIILKESFPYALLTLLMLVYSKVDTVLLKELNVKGNEEVGSYAAAYRIIDAMNMIAVLFAGLLYPLFSKSIKEKVDVSKLVNTSFSILVLPSIIAATLLYIHSDNIMNLLYHENTEYSSALFRNLLISFIFICNSYIFGTYLTAKGEIKTLNRIALLATIINICLNVIFIPNLGASASCVIAIITFGLVTILQSIITIRSLKINIGISKFLSFILWLVVIVAINTQLKNYLQNWVFALAFGATISIIFLFIVRLVSVKQVLKLVKSK
jgi:O-antigen/teichoic acid export membrane protein